jgi:hypothetical protein
MIRPLFGLESLGKDADRMLEDRLGRMNVQRSGAPSDRLNHPLFAGEVSRTFSGYKKTFYI